MLRRFFLPLGLCLVATSAVAQTVLDPLSGVTVLSAAISSKAVQVGPGSDFSLNLNLCRRVESGVSSVYFDCTANFEEAVKTPSLAFVGVQATSCTEGLCDYQAVDFKCRILEVRTLVEEDVLLAADGIGFLSSISGSSKHFIEKSRLEVEARVRTKNGKMAVIHRFATPTACLHDAEIGGVLFKPFLRRRSVGEGAAQELWDDVPAKKMLHYWTDGLARYWLKFNTRERFDRSDELL